MQYPVILFYQYVTIEDPIALRDAQREWCAALGLKGRVLIAQEGINGTLAGPRDGVEAYMAGMREDPRFATMEFKISEGAPETFPRLRIKVRKEIVTLNAGIPLEADRDNHLSPAQWKAMIEDDPEVVLVDVRNRYEWEVGRFVDALPCEIDHFRELPGYLDELAPLQDKKVLMYCTGGIRCEKASALFRARGFKQVFQLHGGIAEYQKAYGNAHWLGDCFVFDERMTLRVEEGYTPVGRCAHSGRASNRFVNCLHDPCHVLFILAPETEEENPEARLCPNCLAAGLTSATAYYKRAS